MVVQVAGHMTRKSFKRFTSVSLVDMASQTFMEGSGFSFSDSGLRHVDLQND